MLKWLFGDDFSLKKDNDYLHSHHMMPSTGALPGILIILSIIGLIVYLFFD